MSGPTCVWPPFHRDLVPDTVLPLVRCPAAPLSLYSVKSSVIFSLMFAVMSSTNFSLPLVSLNFALMSNL